MYGINVSFIDYILVCLFFGLAVPLVPFIILDWKDIIKELLTGEILDKDSYDD